MRHPSIATLALRYHGHAKAFYALSSTPVHALDAFADAQSGAARRAVVFGIVASCLWRAHD